MAHKTRSSLVPALFVVVLFAPACAPESEPASNSTDEEVRTARCPTTVSAQLSSLSMRSYFPELRLASQYRPMKALAAAIAARGSLSFTGELEAKKSGRCTYVDGDKRAELYTKAGKDVLRFSFYEGAQRYYAFTTPKAYSPALTYEAGATAKLVAVAPGPEYDPFDDVDESEAAAPLWTTLGTGEVSTETEPATCGGPPLNALCAPCPGGVNGYRQIGGEPTCTCCEI